MNLSAEHVERLRAMLARPGQRIVTVAHTNPDGDAVGSSLAWAEALRAAGHGVTCIVPNKYPYFLDWMPGIDEIVVFKNDAEGRALKAVAEADAIFCLDFNSLSRLEILSDTIAANTTARRVLIDHHLSPDEGFDAMFSYPESSSTCYLVYRLIKALWGTEAITRSMAEALYVGMMTDTGNFAFSALTPGLFRAVAVLVERGIHIPTIHNNVYNAYTEGRARLFGYAINRKMQIIEEGTVAYMSLMEHEMPFFSPTASSSACRCVRAAMSTSTSSPANISTAADTRTLRAASRSSRWKRPSSASSARSASSPRRAICEFGIPDCPNRRLHSVQRRFGCFVDKLLIKIAVAFGPFDRYFLLLFPSEVPSRRLPARDQKGTPVRIRDYARSCKLRRVLHTLVATAPSRAGRRAEGASQKTCLAGSDRCPRGHRAGSNERTAFFSDRTCLSRFTG